MFVSRYLQGICEDINTAHSNKQLKLSEALIEEWKATVWPARKLGKALDAIYAADQGSLEDVQRVSEGLVYLARLIRAHTRSTDA